MQSIIRITKAMIPATLNLMLSSVPIQINIMFAGKFNDKEILAGIGLATSLIQCFPYTITIGFGGALETLVS